MARILIVEDDKELSKIMRLELAHEGFEAECAFDGREALEKISEAGGDFSLVLLDVMLPRVSGLEVLRKLRDGVSVPGAQNLPVILVTARGETVDKVDGLNSGADDYITKPFRIEELLARMNAVLRRTQKSDGKPSVLKNGFIEMIVDEMKVLCSESFDKESDKESRTDGSGNLINQHKKTGVELSKNEFLLLKYFLENQEKVLSRDEIIKTVWGEDYFIEENSVDVYVRHLRAKFGDELIKTVRGMGYIMPALA